MIETLAALVVLSLVFTSVWSWFGTTAQSTMRIEETMALPQAFDEYMEYMSLESLQEITVGETEIDEFKFKWQASVNRQSDKEFFRRQRSRVVTLFDLDVEIIKQRRVVADISTQIVREWRDPQHSPQDY